MRGKRGQIFILAAIIIVLSIISVSIKYNTAREYPLLVDYEQISGNYLSEIPKIINYAKFINANPVDLLDPFTKSYVETARAKDPKFGVFYAYKSEDGVTHIVNTLNNRVLNIKVNQLDGQSMIIKFYGDVQTGNSICISGMGCNTVTARTQEFGGEFVNVKDLRNVRSIKVCLSGTTENPTDCTNEIRDIIALTNTEKPIEELRALVEEARGGEIPSTGESRTNVDVIVEEYK